jgi:peptidoglycan/xylan/chitin deacetylase (PgdA/CDA1 family)
MAARRRLRKPVLIALMIFPMALILSLFLFFNNWHFVGVKSIHEDAHKYKTRHCLAFYPQTDDGKAYAKSLCKGVKDDTVYDYSLVPYGDYYLVSYGNDLKYFVDKDMRKMEIKELTEDAKLIFIDYLRYEIKKNDPSNYYNSSYISNIDIGHVDFDKISYRLEGEELKVDFTEYGYQSAIPLKYLQNALNMNLGYPYEVYRRPIYISDVEEHPVLCLTFNDGPDFAYEKGVCTSEKIVDLLNRYDACGTFYVLGRNLQNREVWADYQAYYFLTRAINRGHEYGSFTQNRYDLTSLDKEKISQEIMGPADYARSFLDYEMKTYRPIGGEFDEQVLAQQPLPAILWSIDSLDWMYDSGQEVYDEIMGIRIDPGDIIVMHDIYEESYDALVKLLPALIDQGYQLLSVTDMLNAYGIDIATLKYCYHAGYYE